jgi:XTP/dITP diphosphohydrolase
MKLRLLSSNQHKSDEIQSILAPAGITLVPVAGKIDELQTEDLEALVKAKALEAFKKLGHPLLVEHTGLYLESMNGLPGGLTQLFWDKLQADRFCELYGKPPNNRVEARTVIGYCDGQRIWPFPGRLRGRVVEAPRGSRDFAWDCVFQPDGFNETLAELKPETKSEISMRRQALDAFVAELRKRGLL